MSQRARIVEAEARLNEPRLLTKTALVEQERIMADGSVKTVHVVRKMKIGRSEMLDLLCREAGRIYTLCVVWFWRHVRRHGVWLSQYGMQKRLSNGQPTILHSQSAQKAVEYFFHALKTWRSERKTNPTIKPPHKLKKFFKIVWKRVAIRLIDGDLVLSNAKKTDPFVVKGWKFDLPVQVEIGWDGNEYELRATYEVETEKPEDGLVASCDLGEVHPACIGTEDFHLILNGGLLRSKRRYREKLKAKLSSKIDRKKKGGKRRKRLIDSKQRKLKRLNNQIRDIEHKLTSAAINVLHERGARTLVIGDLRDIRVGKDWGKVQNQRMHQAPTGRIRRYLEYKAERLGWETALQNEAWTSKTCPACGARNTPTGRVYKCPCGFVGHRDVVGQVNILHKYHGNAEGCRVIGAMASPSGLRYAPHIRCSSRRSARIPALKCGEYVKSW
jgi:putative transposase